MNQFKLSIFDGHNDALLSFAPFGDGQPQDFFDGVDSWQLDFPKAKQGNFGGGFFAVYIPGKDFGNIMAAIQTGETNALQDITASVPYEEAAYPALQMIALLYRLEALSQGRFRVVQTALQLQNFLARGVIAAVLHFEGAEAIDEDLYALEVFHKAGLRSIGIVHSRNNQFGYGVPMGYGEKPDHGPGLTAAGRRLVKRCNELGIAIDVSHLNYKGFWDVANDSNAPLIATHSCAYALCQSPRNLMDDQLDAIAQSDGIVGVNFFIGFLREDGSWDKATPVDTLVNHIEYMVERMGIDHVAFGSDYGVITAPNRMPNIAGYPHLMRALAKRGYDEDAQHKLAQGNWLRVLRKTWGK